METAILILIIYKNSVCVCISFSQSYHNGTHSFWWACHWFNNDLWYKYRKHAHTKMISDQYLISFSHNRQYAPHHCMKCTIMLATVSSFVEIFQSGFGSQHRTEKALVKDVNDPLLVLCWFISVWLLIVYHDIFLERMENFVIKEGS